MDIIEQIARALWEHEFGTEGVWPTNVANPDDWLDQARAAHSVIAGKVAELTEALEPFAKAGQRGIAVAEAVKAANLQKAGLTPLMCPEIPAGVHAAESLISFADWKRVAALAPYLERRHD